MHITVFKVAGRIAAGVLALGCLSPSFAQDASTSSSAMLTDSSSSAACDTGGDISSGQSSMVSSDQASSEGQIASGQPPGRMMVECSDASSTSGADTSSASAM